MICTPSILKRSAVLVLLSGLALGCAHTAPAPLPESKANDIGYPDVESARRALLGMSDAKSYTTPDGWLVVELPAQYQLWTFTPATDPANPAVVKRTITTHPDGDVYIEMSVLCGASKEACDDLVRRFQALNQQIVANLKQGGHP